MRFSYFLRGVIYVSALLCITANAQTVNWMNWTAPGAYPLNNAVPAYTYANGASGTLTLPDTSVVNVTLTGEVLDQSCFTVALGGCPGGYWAGQGWTGAAFPVGTFTSTNVPSVPPTVNLIVQAGYQLTQHTLTFSQPVTNVVMNIISLGNPGGLSAYQFTRDFTILSQKSTCVVATGVNCLVKNGLTLSGREGAGTIQFLGTYSTITWTVTVPEYYSGFNVGVTSFAAPVSSSAEPVPTLSEWGMGLLVGMMMLLGATRMRGRKS